MNNEENEEVDVVKQNIKVDWIVVESMQVHFERINKRLSIALIIAIIITFLTNLAWLYAWLQYDYSSSSTSTITVDGKDGTANYIGNDGDINNGKDYSEENTKKNTSSQE